MANRLRILLFSLLACLGLILPGCLNRPAYEINVSYINDDLLAQEETLAQEQLRQARARYEEALRSGAAAPGGPIEKEFTAAREKCVIIKKERALRAGRELTNRDIDADPELAIPQPPNKSPRTGDRPNPAPDAPRDATSPDADAALPTLPPQSAAPAPTGATDRQADLAADVPAPPRATYTVAKGDTLGAIAKRHAVAVTKLAAYNSLADGNRLTPGQVLMIPPQ